MVSPTTNGGAAPPAEAAEPEIPGVALGPFDFWPDAASRVTGLGGAEPPPDPGYVFHTLYLPCPTGPLMFRLAFRDLQANAGTLTLQVNELADRPEAYAQVTEIKPIRLRALARRGVATVSIEAQPNHSYALYGRLSDGVEASAKALTIAMIPGMERGAKGIARSAAFRAVGAVPLLASHRAPTLARPASQVSTAPQQREETWARLSGEGLAWPDIYSLRCLEVAELTRPGARVLLIGERANAVAGALRGFGCEVDHVSEEGELFENGLEAGLLSEQYDAAVWLDAGEWAVDERGTVEAALTSVHPGGLGVFVWRYADAPGNDGVARAALERLAIVLLSHQHDVAQMKFCYDPIPPARTWSRRGKEHADTANSVTWFGMLVRRGAP